MGFTGGLEVVTSSPEFLRHHPSTSYSSPRRVPTPTTITEALEGIIHNTVPLSHALSSVLALAHSIVVHG